MGEDEIYARESSPQPGRRMRGNKVTGHRETGRKEKGRKETGRKETGCPTVLIKGDDVVACLPWAKIEAITEMVENIICSGKGKSVLVHVGTNNVKREGNRVRKYWQLVRTLKQMWVKQVFLSGILPLMGRRG